MLEKYLNFFKGRRDAANDAPISHPGDAATALQSATRGGYGNAVAMLQRFIGRQPILDGNSQIVGYELKIRGHGLWPEVEEPEAQRRVQDEMLLISVIDLDFQHALGNRLTFISVAPSMLDHPVLEQLPKHKVAIGIRLPDAVDDALLARCSQLVARGIPLALDDFEYRPEYAPFLKISTYVRLDTVCCDALTLGQRIAEIQGTAMPLLIAGKVETDDAFDAYRQLSFKLFQGYYFTHPQPSAPHRLDNNRLRVIELLNLVMNRAELAELEEKIKLDPGLTYKLLNFINSPANGLRHEIRSIGHVLTLLGYDQLYRWLTLLLFNSGNADGRSRALLKSALVRARFTETLGKDKFKPAEQGGLFIVGIFSLLDALLNVPMEQALARLNLPQAVVDALVRNGGMYAPYLQLALACENFDQEAIARCAALCGLDADAVNVTHVNALIWGEGLDV